MITAKKRTTTYEDVAIENGTYSFPYGAFKIGPENTVIAFRYKSIESRSVEIQQNERFGLNIPDSFEPCTEDYFDSLLRENLEIITAQNSPSPVQKSA